MRKELIAGFCALALLLFPLAAAAQADLVKEGKELFRWQCYKTCHFLNNPYAARDERESLAFLKVKAALLGPDLRGVYDAPAGRRTKEGFRHSGPFLTAAPNIVWTEEMLDRWLTDAQAVIPGSWMAVKITDPEERKKIIAFLKGYQ